MSSRELVVRYVRERARLRVFVPLAVLMAATGWWTGGRVDRWTGRTAMEFALAALTALLLALAFRVWDDLEDRARDSREHPHRVTVVAGSITQLVALAIALATTGSLLVAAGPRATARLGAVGAAAVLLALWYRLRRARTDRVVNNHVVLLKYPLLAFAASPTPPSPAALASLYLALCVYEIIDDPTLRASIVARRIAISECALASVIIATATFLGGRLP
jgi:4-hydroxybenzoate polyprenyltransferase